MNLLTIKNLTKAYTNKVLFDDVDFAVNENEKIGIVGINGTGKSSLLKIIAGLEKPDEGSYVKGSNVHISYLPQNPEFESGVTIFDYVVTANRRKDNEWTIEGDASKILNQLGFEDATLKCDSLSGGQKKRVALAAVLLQNTDILILDEPTNHLDRWMTEYLEEQLKNYRGAIVMVTHDRYFLDHVCNRIAEIDRGKLYNYQTNYAGFLELKTEREEMADASEKKRKNIMRRELEWIRRGAQARSTKQKARIQRYEDMKNIKNEKAATSAEFTSVYTRMGKKTVKLSNISKSYEGKTVISDFTHIFLRGESVAFVGHNGCGKSTLMKIITGNEQPDTGSVEIGDTIKIGYFSQENTELDENQRVIDYIKDVAEYVPTTEGPISASVMLDRFLFNPTLQYAKIGTLSGGERRRLYLIRVLMGAPNVLILDEPTNDLDIQTLSILEDYVEQFDGIVILVSHDRYFLDRTADRIFVFDEFGGIKENVVDDAAQILAETAEMSKPDVGNSKASKEKKTWDKGKKALKFSYNEQREFETIEDDIAELEEKIDHLEQDILKSATDFVKLNELNKEKEEMEAQLEEKMERWEYLTDLAERIEQEKAGARS